MENSDEAQEKNVEPVAVKECRHCSEEIRLTAKVCHHCSRVQAGFFRFSNFLRIGEGLAFFASVGLITVALMNMLSTREQLTQAREANSKAQEALTKANEATTKAEAARRDVCNVAQSLADVAEIIPRTNEGGIFDAGGLPQKDKEALKQRVASLRKQISQCS